MVRTGGLVTCRRGEDNRKDMAAPILEVESYHRSRPNMGFFVHRRERKLGLDLV